jgi:hypothetical protein
MSKIYAKNPNSTSIVRLLALGIDIPAKSAVDLLKTVTPYELGNDLELIQRVISGLIIINNGISDMTPTQAIAYLNDKSTYESSKLSDLIFTFGSDSVDYWENKKDDYKNCRQIYFKGAHSIGYPIACKLVGIIQDDKYTATIQLYDDFNDLVIFELEIDDENSSIYTITDFENFPESETVLVLRAKSNKDGKYIRLYSFCLIF